MRAAMVATTATIAGTPIMRPKMISNRRCGCGGFGSSTGMTQVWHRLPGGPHRGQSSSSIWRLRPASIPHSTWGTTSRIISAMGSPQPPLTWFSVPTRIGPGMEIR